MLHTSHTCRRIERSSIQKETRPKVAANNRDTNLHWHQRCGAASQPVLPPCPPIRPPHPTLECLSLKVPPVRDALPSSLPLCRGPHENAPMGDLQIRFKGKFCPLNPRHYCLHSERRCSPSSSFDLSFTDSLTDVLFVLASVFLCDKDWRGKPFFI